MSMKLPILADDRFVMGKKFNFLPTSLLSWAKKPVLVCTLFYGGCHE